MQTATVTDFPTTKATAEPVGTTQARIRAIVGNVERIEADRAGLKEDLAEIYKGAKSEGFDVKVLRKIVALRKRNRNELEEMNEVAKLYLAALGDDRQGLLL